MATPLRLDIPDSGGFRSALSHAAFRNIWFAQLAAQLADKFLLFSLIILAYHVSGGSTPVAVTLLAYTVPAVAMGPIAGVVADRYDRKRIMAWANYGRAATVALIPLAALVPSLSGDFIHLLVITLIFSAVGQLFGPAEASAIPTILPRSALITANSMALLTMVLTLVVGGALAPLVSRINLYAPYWCAVVLLLAAGVLVSVASIPHHKLSEEDPAEAGRTALRALLKDMQEGINVLRANRGLMLAFGQVSLAVLVLFMLFALAPAFVTTVIGIGAQDSYTILVPATGGAILSAILLGQFARNIDRTKLLASSMIANGLTLLALAAVPQAMRQVPELHVHARITGASISLLLGVEFGAILIPAITHLMETTSDKTRGRIFALLYMVINGVTALPVLVAAALSDTIGTGRVIGGLGVLLAVGGTGVAIAARRAYLPKPG